MQHPSLETIAEHLVAHLECAQNDLCLPIVHQVARGKPLTKAALGVSLQMSQEDRRARLARGREAMRAGTGDADHLALSRYL